MTFFLQNRRLAGLENDLMVNNVVLNTKNTVFYSIFYVERRVLWLISMSTLRGKKKHPILCLILK